MSIEKNYAEPGDYHRVDQRSLFASSTRKTIDETLVEEGTTLFNRDRDAVCPNSKSSTRPC
eukprot:664141-Amphidinium_carterae.1